MGIGVFGVVVIMFIIVQDDKNEETLVCGASCTLLFVGDVGNNEDSARTINHIQQYDYDGIFIAGDLSYSNPSDWFDLTRHLDRDKTFIAIGNHELTHDRTAWLEPYGLSRSYYSVSNKLVNIIMLDSELKDLDAQKQFWFVENVLHDNESEFIIIVLHRPLYGNKRLLDDYRLQYQPVFDKYQVDLVVQGHNHQYERMIPLLSKTKPSDQGQVYITVGTGGRSLTGFESRPPWSAVQFNEDFGILKLDVTNMAMKGQFVTNNQTVIDEFVIYNNKTG